MCDTLRDGEWWKKERKWEKDGELFLKLRTAQRVEI